MLAAPHGVDDVIHLRVRPTDHFAASKERMVIYKDRMRNKRWERIWNNLEIDQS